MTLSSDDNTVRLHIVTQAANTGRVPQAPAIASALGRSEAEIRASIKNLAAEKILMLAPNDGVIWAAAPFCATPSPFYVVSNGVDYSAICIWDALGIPAALHQDAVIHTVCGDCGDAMTVKIRDGNLVPAEGIIHFGVPARNWWDNIGFT
ncbi:MAG TPA: organomercurial lyase [Gemmatimonadaceae bacterium]|nr:organomercurial lyase [Gemmatimonadaceae bacterium]